MKQRKNREVLAVNQASGECRRFGSVCEFAKENGVVVTSAQQALERGWACNGWRIYDTPERIKGRIADLENELNEVEQILKKI